MALNSPEVSLAAPPCERLSAQPLKLLAFVHLRNIHASTGAGRVARQLTEHLALRPDVELRILADSADQARILPLVGKPWTDFRYHTFASDTSRQQARWFAFDKPLAESYWPNAQVIFCTGESYVPTTKARLVVTLHDAAYFEQSAHKRDRSFLTQQIKWKILFHKLSKRADMFHTVSHFSAARLTHFFPQIASRIKVVPNAVTPRFFSPVTPAGELYLAEENLAGRSYLLIPGGLHFRKNADLILEAAPLLLSKYPELVLAVVNHSDPWYAARLQALGRNVRMLGFVSDDALHALYASAALVWFPSRYEGFGMPILEAMACGAPVVASNASSIPEVAGDAAFLADPDDPRAHIDAIEYVLTNSQAAAQMVLAGKNRASEFTWDKAAARLKRAMDSLL